MEKFSPDQKRVAAAILTMLKKARRSLHPAAEGVLRSNFGLHHPDTKPLLALIPSSEELPSLAMVLEKASSSVLDALGRLAKLCIRSGMTALELFQRDCAFERQPDDTDVVEGVMEGDPSAARNPRELFTHVKGPSDPILPHQIRPDLAALLIFMREKVIKEKGRYLQRFVKIYNSIMPGKLCLVITCCCLHLC